MRVFLEEILYVLRSFQYLCAAGIFHLFLLNQFNLIGIFWIYIAHKQEWVTKKIESFKKNPIKKLFYIKSMIFWVCFLWNTIKLPYKYIILFNVFFFFIKTQFKIIIRNCTLNRQTYAFNIICIVYIYILLYYESCWISLVLNRIFFTSFYNFFFFLNLQYVYNFFFLVMLVPLF